MGTPPFGLLGAEDRAKLPAWASDAYPLARVQFGVLYDLLAHRHGRPYVVSTRLVRAPFDGARLAAAIDAVAAAHDIMRTSFDLTTFAEPMQLVRDGSALGFGHTDLRTRDPADRGAGLAAFLAAERARAFTPDASPLFGIHVHLFADDRWQLSLTACRAAVDERSREGILSELVARYLSTGGRPPQVRYADFVALERDSLADLGFWARRLDGCARLTLPSAWAGAEEPERHQRVVPWRDLDAGLRKLAAAADTSVSSVLLAAHTAVWLIVADARSWYGGLVCDGRLEEEGGEQMRGLFGNTVPFLAPTGAATWCDLVRGVADERLAVRPHRRTPLLDLQREFGDGGPLVEVAFDAQGTLDAEAARAFPVTVSSTATDLVIDARSADLAPRHAESLAAMYRRALTLMAADPEGDARVSLLPPGELLPAGIRKQSRGVLEQVAEHAIRAPDAVAVQAGGERWTYAELLARAGSWAHLLRHAGMGMGDLVGVCLRREPDLVAAVLGVLATGAAYVPLDPQHPEARIARLVGDTGVRAVVTVPELAAAMAPVEVLLPHQADDVSAVLPLHRPRPDDLIYVVHTSGSTGRPKGVMVRHGALADRVMSMTDQVRMTDRDVVAEIVPMVTDVAQLAIFVALANGATLVLADGDDARDPASLAGLLRTSGATFMQASPTTWRLLTETGWLPPAGFRVLSGGEAMSADLVDQLCAGVGEVWNMYGPSEATVFCFGTRLTGQGAPAWVPAANTTVYLLNEDLEPVPSGMTGQIFVGGDGLAGGYLGDPALTAARFPTDPFSTEPGARMYATGDIGRRRDDGQIEILGRRDHQLKIRGVRVELGEIENTLIAHPAVRDAVVLPAPGPQGDPRLAAHVLSHDGRLTVDELRDHAAAILPEYLIPTSFLIVDSFPRLANGKIDRAALPLPDILVSGEEPQGPVERAIAGAWAGVLGLERVGREDDFFAVGGDSLLTLRVIARLRTEHRIDLTVREFLSHPTVRGLATAVRLGLAERSRRSALLWLGDSGDRDPLFCLHPGGGSAMWYRHLAEAMAPDRPLAAFEWPGLHSDRESAGSVTQLATRYLAELRSARPSGPYNLLGWCGSSGIAWEMALRLHEAGEPHRLILLDPLVGPDALDTAPILANLAAFRRAEALFGALERDGTRKELLSVLRGVVDDTEVWFEEEDLGGDWARRVRVWRELLEIRLRHRFPKYPGSVRLVLSEDLADARQAARFGRSMEEYLAEWRRLAVDGLTVDRVPGDHRGAVRPPHVRVLAATLARIIDDDHREA